MISTVVDPVIEKKLERISKGGQPRVLDLFSGCGGISLGFNLAGCEIIGGIDFDPHASRSHAMNFHSDLHKGQFEIHASAKDITSMSPQHLLHLYGYDLPEDCVDILVGGPPCPAFARVGRAKLREVHEHPDAFRRDPRAKLYLPYLEYVKKVKPVVLLMENVPDILNYGGHNLAEEICEILEEWNYRCAYTLLNSANYGVPQMRERFFLIGIHESINEGIGFPKPTRLVDFPQGYKGSRQVALKHIEQNELFSKDRYVPTPQPSGDAGAPVSVRQAIEDLPQILSHLDGTMKRGARRFDTAVTYRKDVSPSAFATFMRTWPGFKSDGSIWDHVTRSLSTRDYRLFANMSEGDDYPKAHKLAKELFSKALNGTSLNDNEYEAMQAKYIPPYDLGKDSYSHIHYDSEQSRVVSVREAARLQSFPDGFKFSGTMNPAFRQIGNAVPPLMAFALAQQILQTIYTHLDSPSNTVLLERISKYVFLSDYLSKS
jgi:DNA (cytosine-5)-methyltransferase 1